MDVSTKRFLFLWMAVLIPVIETYGFYSLATPGSPYESVGFMASLLIGAFWLYLTLEQLALQPQPKGIAVHLLALAVALGVFEFVAVAPYAFALASSASVLSALCLLVPAGALLSHVRKHPAVLGFALLALVVAYCQYMVKRALWHNDYVFGLTIKTVFAVVRGVGYELLPADPGVLKTAAYSIQIFMSCSGLEGITFFIIAFSLLLMMDSSYFSWRRIIVTYILGMLFMWTLNVLRIVLIFWLANWMTEQWGRKIANQLAIDLFHTNVGWIIYAVGILVFFTIFFKTAQKKS